MHKSSSSKIDIMNSWSSLLQRAKLLESRLEGNVSRFGTISQKVNADFLCDEENPLVDREEQDLTSDVERD